MTTRHYKTIYFLLVLPFQPFIYIFPIIFVFSEEKSRVEFDLYFIKKEDEKLNCNKFYVLSEGGRCDGYA